MKIKFVKNFKHSDNGYDIVEHEAGSVKDVSEACGLGAVATGCGIDLGRQEEKEPEKMEPEHNKALPGPKKNKAK